nr:hypothetical protein [uncultured Cupriavidus sp.]
MEMLPPTILFFFALHIVAIIRALMIRGTGISLPASASALLAGINWPQLWAIQILLVTLIINYCVIAELGRVIGRDKLKAIILGPLPRMVSERSTRP